VVSCIERWSHHEWATVVLLEALQDKATDVRLAAARSLAKRVTAGPIVVEALVAFVSREWGGSPIADVIDAIKPFDGAKVVIDGFVNRRDDCYRHKADDYDRDSGGPTPDPNAGVMGELRPSDWMGLERLTNARPRPTRQVSSGQSVSKRFGCAPRHRVRRGGRFPPHCYSCPRLRETVRGGSDGLPITCPKCKSPYWNRERERRK
jgi:hypothetical protein